MPVAAPIGKEAEADGRRKRQHAVLADDGLEGVRHETGGGVGDPPEPATAPLRDEVEGRGDQDDEDDGCLDHTSQRWSDGANGRLAMCATITNPA